MTNIISVFLSYLLFAIFLVCAIAIVVRLAKRIWRHKVALINLAIFIIAMMTGDEHIFSHIMSLAIYLAPLSIGILIFRFVKKKNLRGKYLKKHQK